MALLFSILAYAQRQKPFGPQPEVGKPMVDFTLTDITNYKATTANLNDFKGKWVFLDFWFTGCKVCVESWPKVNEFQNQFKDKIQYMLIGDVDDSPGSWQKSEGTKRVFEKMKAKQNLIIPCVYDSLLTRKWGINAMPYIIIIDPNGIVKAITDGRDLTAEKIKELIAGGSPDIFPSIYQRIRFGVGVDHINPKPSDSLILFQSSLNKYNNEDFEAYPVDFQLNQNKFIRKGVQLAGLPLYMIYNCAYFGEPNWTRYSPLYSYVYPKPILEISDSTFFKIDVADQKKGVYNYKISLPVYKTVNKENIMGIMQNDLKSYFGYDSSIETRKMPYYSLVVLPGGIKKLINSGTPKRFEGEGTSPAGFKALGFRLNQLIGSISQHNKELQKIPFLDETGILDPIDLIIDADMSQLNGVKRELQKNGLDIVKREREFKVLVIRDPKPKTFITSEMLTNRLLSKADSNQINKIIQQYIPFSKAPDWNNLAKALKDRFPENSENLFIRSKAEEILLNTKVEYYLAKQDLMNFETYIKPYSLKYLNNIKRASLLKYAYFLFKHSLDTDILQLAHEWSKIYLISKDVTMNDWFVCRNVLYKIRKLKGIKDIWSTADGPYTMKGILKSDPNNKLYQETLAKMEKGEPTW